MQNVCKLIPKYPISHPMIGTSGGPLRIQWSTFGFHKMLGNYRVASQLVASRVELISIQLVSIHGNYRVSIHKLLSWSWSWIYDWQTIRPICLGVRHPSGIRDQFFFLLEISFRQLQVWYFVAPSLMRGWVCNLLYNCFWALPELSPLGRSPAELMAIFYCLIWDSPNQQGQVPVFISPRNRVAQLYPRALGSLFVASYDSQGYGGGILTRLHTGHKLLVKINFSLEVIHNFY
jgi:hypothetical protein